MKLNNTLSAIFIAIAPLSTLAGEPLARFNVAEDISRFVSSPGPIFADGTAAYGNAFVRQGYIYPAGTLSSGLEGTLPNGKPAFPDFVIGEWTCDGFFVGEGMRTETGAIVVTRQTYRFNDGDLLISHGPELADPGVIVTRAVTGGTRDYAGAAQALDQTMLGMSEGYGVRLRIELDLLSPVTIDVRDHTLLDSDGPAMPVSDFDAGSKG